MRTGIHFAGKRYGCALREGHVLRGAWREAAENSEVMAHPAGKLCGASEWALTRDLRTVWGVSMHGETFTNP
jgi:hypothetical protein